MSSPISMDERNVQQLPISNQHSRGCGTRHSQYSTSRLSNEAIRQKRCHLFGQEKARQLASVTRVEKIEVQHVGPPENCTLLMNKDLSTPFNCAMLCVTENAADIQELLMTRSVLALVNDQPWDMHRPLTDNCKLRFLHFKDEDPSVCNEAFWRTGSFLIGYVFDRAFKDEYNVELCSFPRPDVQSGSFIYDVNLNELKDWKPSQAELNCLSRIAATLQSEDTMFERLDVDASLALQMFEDNRYKHSQIPHIASQSPSGSTVTLYRLKDHVDITRGPLISSTQLLARFTITAIHGIESPDYGRLQRVQGLAMPRQLPIHFWTYDFLCKRASQLNQTAPIPRSSSSKAQKLAAAES